MSKIGKMPIEIPPGVEIVIEKSLLIAKGAKGEVSVKIPKVISIEQEESTLFVKKKEETKDSSALHGLTRSLINNAVIGVSVGFSKTLELSGVGFRANAQGGKLVLLVGYSHPVEIDEPEGINIEVAENKIKVSGFDKQLVGDVASRIRKVRVAEPYKGKGIKYQGEVIRRKPGKAQAVGGTV